MSDNQDNNKNNQQNKSEDYTLIQSIDENKGLLQSVNGIQLISEESSNNSQCDVPIIISSSNLDDSKIYNPTIVKNSSYKDDCKLKKKVSYKLCDKSGMVEFTKDITEKFFDLFRWRRQYDSFMQLYTQIALDGMLITYLLKKSQKLNQYRQSSIKEEKIFNECIQDLNKDGIYFFNRAQAGQKVVCKGSISDTIAIAHINNKIRDSKYNKELQNKYVLKGNKENVDFKFDKDFKYQNKSSMNTENNKKATILSGIGASITSFFSGKLFKSKISIEEGFKSNFEYYFLGTKISYSGKTSLEVNTIFKDINLQNFKAEQAAYLASIFFASGISIYLGFKLIKNVLYLAKKKKLFRKK